MWGRGIKFKRGEENIKDVGKNISWKKGKLEVFPLILRLLGRISCGEGALEIWERKTVHFFAFFLEFKSIS